MRRTTSDIVTRGTALRVLIIGDASSVLIEHWVAEMRRRGHEVLLMSPAVPRETLRSVTLSTERGPRIPLLRPLLRIARIRRQIRRFNPHVVHGHYALDYGLWAVLAAGRVPTLVTCWGSDILLAPRQSRGRRVKVRLALRKATYVTATSHYVLQQALTLAGARLQGEVINWGVDTSAFVAASTPLPTPLTIISTRQHTPLYNVDVIIRAFAELRRTGTEARLVLVGSGPSTGALKALARSLGVYDDVRFTGWVKDDELPGLYRAADIYVSVPSSDASAASNMEAMATGLAVVASDLPSVREWVEDGVTGALVPVRDVQALADALGELIADSKRRSRLGVAARRLVEQRGNRQVQMDRASSLYQQLAREGAR